MKHIMYHQNFLRMEYNMAEFKIGDVVVRKSYGEDVYFRIANITKEGKKEPVFNLKGLSLRLEADSFSEDLIKKSSLEVKNIIKNEICKARGFNIKKKNWFKLPFKIKSRASFGKILHIDSSKEYLEICLEHYLNSNLKPIGKRINENEQPLYIKELLHKYTPDILVITGHDAMKKEVVDVYSIENYRNSKYFVESVKIARKYQSDTNKLSIFAGACQSYYEAIMSAGANFASSPGRVLINALDPAFVAQTIAVTDYRKIICPSDIAKITVSKSKGIGGVCTKGHMI